MNNISVKEQGNNLTRGIPYAWRCYWAEK